MNNPAIGVTMARGKSIYGYSLLTVTEAYVQAIIRAGACPVLIPIGLSENAISTLLSKLDGILFTGGGDVHPDRYGGQTHPMVKDVDTARDQIEIHLLHRTLEKKLPFLGICRGLQVINIALGGTIYEDILDQKPASLKHSNFPDMPRTYLAHTVEIEQDSRLATIVDKPTAPVNSLHHQGIRVLAPQLRATAFAPDGLIEAVEIPDYNFGLAVQWHPEWLPAEASMDNLFIEFVFAAQK